MTTPGVRLNPVDRRRSQHVVLPVAVRMSGKGPHGRRLEVGDFDAADEFARRASSSTGEETNCTLRDINSIPGGLVEIGLEFTKVRSRIWRVAFPPPDGSPRSPEAKRFVSPTSVAPKIAK